jgi:flagellar assembly factor FliW
MKLKTLHFGEIEVADETEWTFLHGIPGFEHLTQFTIVQQAEHLPFSYLQSLEEGAISFIITNPFLVYPEYEFELPDFAQEELAISEDAELAIWSIVTLKDDVEGATINLLAPIVLNAEKRRGKQIILHDSSYTTKHPLLRGKSKASDHPSTIQSEGGLTC